MNEPASTTYLVELFAPQHDAERLRAEMERIQAAVAAPAASGVAIRYLRSILLPDEETAFHLFEAERSSSVERALQDAGLEVERISTAVAVP